MKIVATPTFLKEARHLSKKYASFRADLIRFTESLTQNPDQGVKLSCGYRKIRMAITSKAKGKSGGARIITFHCIVNDCCDRIVLVMVYDKSDRASVSIEQLKAAFDASSR